MKRVILRCTCLLVLLCAAIEASAQDIIVLKDGSLIQSKVSEVNPTTIRYRKSSNPDGPLYTIERSDVLAINYANGEKETFGNTAPAEPAREVQPSQEQNLMPREIEVVPAADNAELIARYNALVTLNPKVKRKESPIQEATGKFGITAGSVLSDDNVEIRIELDNPHYCCQYAIVVHNKTDHPLYVDLGNTFRVDGENSHLYYDGSTQTTVSHGSESGGSVGLGSVASVLGIGGAVGTLAGGITLGGSNQHSTATTYIDQRVLVVPPQGKRKLSTHKEVETRPGGLVRDRETKILSHGEGFGGTIDRIRKGETRNYTEADSPLKIDYLITYSTEESFAQYSMIRFGLFLQQAFGADFFNYDWSSYIDNTEFLIEHFGKFVAQYDSYQIYGIIWAGKHDITDEFFRQ